MTADGQFNEAQTSRILAGVSYMDKLLIDVDQIMAASDSQALPKYMNPLTPGQVRTIRDYIKRLRSQMVHVLHDVRISLPPPRFDSTHCIRVFLQFIEVSIESLAPERLAGYGEPPERLLPLLTGGLQEMKGIVRQMDAYLVQQPEADLSARLSRISETASPAGLLKEISAVIDRHGFVEFRAPLSRLAEKIENPVYEIAFFGRVSAGKSSLLNRIAGISLLPTGVTPVTAVPTRIRHRPEPGLLVASAGGQLIRYDLDRLAEFVTEAGNPGNEKRLTLVMAELPLALLPTEVVLVDTPGLGSLALQGAAETLAYLPNCDLGVVLVDASSNLQADDIAILDALRAASASVLLVLSKADLVEEHELARLLDYTRAKVSQELGTAVSVKALSSRPEQSSLLNKWIDEDIVPRMGNAKALARESNERKATVLARGVIHALEVVAKTATLDHAASNADDLKKAETRLRDSATLVEAASSECYRITLRIRERAKTAIEMLADRAISHWQMDDSGMALDEAWMQSALNSIAQTGADELANLILPTAEKLSRALEEASRVTAGNRDDPIALTDLVREMPVPDGSVCSLRLRKPRLLAISKPLAKRSVQTTIRSHCGALIANFFNTYGHALELWFQKVLNSMEKDFNASAEIYRAQMQRISSTEQVAPSRGKDLQQDISRLKELV